MSTRALDLLCQEKACMPIYKMLFCTLIYLHMYIKK